MGTGAYSISEQVDEKQFNSGHRKELKYAAKIEKATIKNAGK